ncbi:MAG: fumarate hydratase [delta proteobacterium MLS_D]|jgi:fumarate hydratase subunit alpha|nr:MAG: fumarate hydratase [delta proteobacterium MLS_D]
MGSLREIPVSLVADRVRELFLEANWTLGADVRAVIEGARDAEDSELGRWAFDQIVENIDAARRELLPLCQDTGLAVVFIEIGQDVHLVGGHLVDAVNEGVRRAYGEGYFRKSVCDPLTRTNTGDNTPAVIHVEIVPGDQLHLLVMPKGGGSENMSTVEMLTPSAGEEGIKRYIVETVRRAGPNPCPPIIVGVGIGGSMEAAALLAKKTLARSPGRPNEKDPRLATLERELLDEINALGIGAQGYGGTTTALAVHVDMIPCHIASLPVAVNIQCHVARHRETII